MKLAKLERIPCFPQLFTRASTRGRGSKQLARGQSSNISNLPFHQKVSIFAEEETFASSMCTSFIEIYENMIVKLRDPGFAFLPVCHLDSEEDLRPQRTGSNIFFCCRPNYLSHFSSSFLYNLMDKNMSACRLIPTAQNLFLRQQLALERQKVRDGVLNL